jgi:hypothetical protein
MHTWIDTAVERPSTTAPAPLSAPPVDDLLRVYLGQSCGSRAPQPDGLLPSANAQELWDYLGDFA